MGAQQAHATLLSPVSPMCCASPLLLANQRSHSKGSFFRAHTRCKQVRVVLNAPNMAGKQPCLAQSLLCLCLLGLVCL